MPRHKIGVNADFKAGQMKEVQVEGAPYLIANVDGKLYSLWGRCSHMGGILANGSLDGFVVQCPKHGSKFDVRNGNVVRNPVIPLIGKAKQMRTYPVVVEGDDVYLLVEE